MKLSSASVRRLKRDQVAALAARCSSEQQRIELVTIVLVGAVRVAVDDAGLSVRGPASVSDAEVGEQLLLQVQRIFLWRHRGSIDYDV